MTSFSVDIGAIVADVDMTIINDGQSELSCPNLDALVEALNRKIPVLLISGSPYDSVYCGVVTSGALSRRVEAPLRRALERTRTVDNLHGLKIFYASGRGTVRFDAAGNELRAPDRTDKDIDAALQSTIFRAFLCSFFAVKKELEADATSPSLEKIWNFTGSDEQAADAVRQLLKDETRMDVGQLEKWAFGSELALVFHGTHASGPTIAVRAQTLLRRKNISLSPDFFWAGGIDYAKASRIRKRDIIETALSQLEQTGALKPGTSVLMFGDSNVDDFLLLKKESYVPIFLGSKSDAANFPTAWLAVDHAGHDRQQARAFGPVLKSMLDKQPVHAPFALVRS